MYKTKLGDYSCATGLLLAILLPQLQLTNLRTKSVASILPPKSIAMHNMETLYVDEDTHLCGLLLLINQNREIRQYIREYNNHLIANS